MITIMEKVAEIRDANTFCVILSSMESLEMFRRDVANLNWLEGRKQIDVKRVEKTPEIEGVKYLVSPVKGYFVVWEEFRHKYLLASTECIRSGVQKYFYPVKCM